MTALRPRSRVVAWTKPEKPLATYPRGDAWWQLLACGHVGRIARADGFTYRDAQSAYCMLCASEQALRAVGAGR